MNEWDSLKRELIRNPEKLRRLCADLGISFKAILMNPNFGATGPNRLLDSYQSGRFAITIEIDDDDLTPEQRKLHYMDLADKCIKKLKEKGVTANVARSGL